MLTHFVHSPRSPVVFCNEINGIFLSLYCQGVRKRVEWSNGLSGKFLCQRGGNHTRANVQLFSYIVVYLLRPCDGQKCDKLSTFDMLASLLDSVRTFFHPSNIGTSVFQKLRVWDCVSYAMFTVLCVVQLYVCIRGISHVVFVSPQFGQGTGLDLWGDFSILSAMRLSSVWPPTRLESLIQCM